MRNIAGSDDAAARYYNVIQPGIYTAATLPNAAYHAAPGISNSGLKLIADKSPKHYWAKYLSPKRQQSSGSRAQFVGTAIHAATLEPELFHTQYVVNPYDDRRGNRYRDLVRDNAGKAIISQAEFDAIQGMHEALYCHPMAGSLLRSVAHTELSMFVVDPDTGMLMKSRPDLVTHSGIVVDLKKTQDASPDGFSRACFNYGYFQQDAFYSDVYEIATGQPPAAFVFIAVEEEYPHAVGVYCLDAADRQRGRLQYRRALELYAECVSTNRWPSYSDKIENLALPEWARARMPV